MGFRTCLTTHARLSYRKQDLFLASKKLKTTTMGLGCSGSCMKYLLFFFNFIFFVCGATLFGIGIWVQFDDTVTAYLGLTVDKGAYEAAIILLICVGAFILLVGFLGCCGACQESTCMLCLFAGLMIIIVLLQVVAAILAIVFSSDVTKELKSHLEENVKEKVSNDTTDPFTQGMNLLQMDDKLDKDMCCGVVSYTDYGSNSKIFNDTGRLVPKSCCVKAEGDKKNPTLSDSDWLDCSNEAAKDKPNEKILKTKGCYQSLEDFLKNNTLYVILAGFLLAFIELVGIVFACRVRSKISEQDF